MSVAGQRAGEASQDKMKVEGRGGTRAVLPCFGDPAEEILGERAVKKDVL